MKRFRIVISDFDSRALLLTMEIKKEWAKDVKAQHIKNKLRIERGLQQEFGLIGAEKKKQNFIDIGSKPISVLSFHNIFFEQIRNSFIIGGYYPALTGACSLGERILNHLVLALRDDFKKTPDYKRIYNKDSFENWGEIVNILEKWGVLLSEVAKYFRKLEKIRNKSIHFRPEIDTNVRELALGAIHCLQDIIKKQFPGFGEAPWIFLIPGESYIKKEWETHPYIKKIYLNNCLHVGPNHTVIQINPWKIRDDADYPNKEISDEEFMILRQNKK